MGAFFSYDIISLRARILYASGGIYVRAIFFAKAKNAHAQLYHVFFKNMI
jgi:hypothetical protein